MVEVTFSVYPTTAHFEQMHAFPLNLQSPFVPIIDVFQGKENERWSLFTVQCTHGDSVLAQRTENTDTAVVAN